MTMTLESKSVGKVIRVEQDEDGVVRLVMEITDPKFKRHVLSSRSFQDIISISGKDVMVVASKSNRDGDGRDTK